MKRSRILAAAITLALTATGCWTPRGAGAGIGAAIGVHEGGIGGAAIGALAGYGAGALIEEEAKAHAHHARVYRPAPRWRPYCPRPVHRHCGCH